MEKVAGVPECQVVETAFTASRWTLEIIMALAWASTNRLFLTLVLQGAQRSSTHTPPQRFLRKDSWQALILVPSNSPNGWQVSGAQIPAMIQGALRAAKTPLAEAKPGRRCQAGILVMGRFPAWGTTC